VGGEILQNSFEAIRNEGMWDVDDLGRLDVRRIVLHAVALPRTHALASNAAVTSNSRPAVYVQVFGAGGEEGWGECCALATPSYTPESAALCFGMLAETMAPILVASGPLAAADVRTVLDAKVKEWNMAKAAVEAAVLDALLRRQSISLVTFLEGKRLQVPAGVAVGMPAGETTQHRLDVYVDEVKARFAEGYRRVRVKAVPFHHGDDWTVLPIKTLRERGVDGMIQPDGNMAYDVAHIPGLASLRDHGVTTFEQPFGRRRLQDHRTLRVESSLAVVGDESIESFDDVLLALDGERRAFDGICNKWSRVGGILEAARINDECVSRGVKVFMGGMIGIGTHVDLALASMIPTELDGIGDHGPSGKWIAADADPTPPIEWVERGFVSPSVQPGVVDIDPGRVESALCADVVSVEM
jgi:O-succinylbenzoate synthase